MRHRSIILLLIVFSTILIYGKSKRPPKYCNLYWYNYSETVRKSDVVIVDSLIISKSLEVVLKNDVIKRIPTQFWMYYSIIIHKKDNVIWFSVSNAESLLNINDLLDPRSKIKSDYYLYGMFRLKSKRFFIVSQKKSEPLTASDLQHFFIQRKEFYRITLNYSSDVYDPLGNFSYWYFLLEDNIFRLVKSENIK